MSNLHLINRAALATPTAVWPGEPDLDAPSPPPVAGRYLCSVCRCIEVDAGEGFDTCADCAMRV